jgi:hypothetical protein
VVSGRQSQRIPGPCAQNCLMVRSIGLALFLIAAYAQAGAVLQVGPQYALAAPSAAAVIAHDGAVVEIAAGTYRGDVAVWTQNDLVLKAVGGRVVLEADGRSAEDKAIWVIKGDHVHVEGIEFSGARVADQNGAGIRFEGGSLSVSRCVFRQNENGILTHDYAGSRLLVELSEFARNGFGDGYSHNLYAGSIAELTVRFSYLHDAHVGHQLKSRARENRILYNRIADEREGDASYLIDLPNPGRAVILGNALYRGPHAENDTLVRLVQNAAIVHNTFVTDLGRGTFVTVAEGGRAKLVNNLFVGEARVLRGDGLQLTNWSGAHAPFIERSAFEYRLARGAPAIDVGGDAGSFMGMDLSPVSEYRHPARGAPRPRLGAPDLGAFEGDAEAGRDLLQ